VSGTTPVERTGTLKAGEPARQAAFEILRAVRAGAPFDAALAAATGLNDPDRRLAHEIAAGVLRSRTQLDGHLAARARHGWPGVAADVKDILRIGAYQLLNLHRVPAHAAVTTAVDLAKREVGPKPAGFVNALLRGVAADRPVSSPTADADDATSLAAKYSHPAWLVARWLERHGAQRTRDLLEHNNTRPAMHLQPARWTAGRLREALQAGGCSFREVPREGGFAVRGGRVADLPGYAEGGFVIQDPAQVWALAHAAVPDDRLVWDACAAPGGKTVSLAQRCRVIASDVSRQRLQRLLENTRRAAPAALVLLADARHPPLPEASVDVVLLDAPCSATGTFAKHPDARWRIEPSDIDRLALQQARLLGAVATTVRPGGHLIYMTCSLEPEENEERIEAFLDRHTSFERDGADLHVFPPDTGSDGAFAARLRRNR